MNRSIHDSSLLIIGTTKGHILFKKDNYNEAEDFRSLRSLFEEYSYCGNRFCKDDVTAFTYWTFTIWDKSHSVYYKFFKIGRSSAISK